MRLYWVQNIIIQGHFLLYRGKLKDSLADYFTKNHPTKHHSSIRSIKLVPTAEIIKYSCYMVPYNNQGCVESLPDWRNGLTMNSVSPSTSGKWKTDGRIWTVKLVNDGIYNMMPMSLNNHKNSFVQDKWWRILDNIFGVSGEYRKFFLYAFNM